MEQVIMKMSKRIKKIHQSKLKNANNRLLITILKRNLIIMKLNFVYCVHTFCVIYNRWVLLITFKQS